MKTYQLIIGFIFCSLISKAQYSGGIGAGYKSDCSSFINNTTATISGGGTICLGENVPDITVALAGQGPWNLTYTVNGTPTTISNILTSPYIISNGLAGNYLITNVKDVNGNDGTYTGTANMVINNPVTPTFTQVGAICSGETLSLLPSTSNESINGTWSPALNNTATTLYTFSPTGGQCASIITMTITVNPLVTPTFTQLGPICSGETLGQLPITSNESIAGTWSPALNNTTTTPYTFTPAGGQCATVGTMTITVNANPTIQAVAQPSTIMAGETSQINITTSGNQFSWTPTSSLSCSSCQNPLANPEISTTYNIVVTNSDGCTSTTNIEIIVEDNCSDLFIPNMFSPNDDLKNDEFCIYGMSCLSDISLMLFNRWGEKLFETTEGNICWDGTFKGKKVAAGVYVYTFRAVNKKGESVEKKGEFTLVR